MRYLPAVQPHIHDVAIAGGGLAGLCLAIQLKQADPEIDVVVVERRSHPAPAAAFKVGESSVEIGSHYFEKVLGLGALLEKEVPKFGLRFFFSQGDNHDIATRLELGPSHFLHVPSYQIDRGQFENGLVDKARELGVDLRFESRITSVTISPEGTPHEISCEGMESVRADWVVDAAGRASLLKRELGLTKKNKHAINSAWFRIDASIDLDRWSDSTEYRGRMTEPRRLSTNHLMGEGYWVWVIPLIGDRTSVGIVADESLHAFTSMNTFARAISWLEQHEPQLAERLAPHLDRRMDSLVLKHFSHGCERCFSAEGWCITGEAGCFPDPFYSPGSDFVGISNGLVADLILRRRSGEDIGARAVAHQRNYATLYRAVMTIYERQYPVMGSARVMSLKILWDFTMYWGGIALLALNHKIADPDFMERANDNLREFAGLGFSMQRFFRRWGRLDTAQGEPPSGFVDYSEMPFLDELNRGLMTPLGDEALLALHSRNIELARELDAEIRWAGAAAQPALRPKTTALAEPTTDHLAPAIATLFTE